MIFKSHMISMLIFALIVSTMLAFIKYSDGRQHLPLRPEALPVHGRRRHRLQLVHVPRLSRPVHELAPAASSPAGSRCSSTRPSSCCRPCRRRSLPSGIPDCIPHGGEYSPAGLFFHPGLRQAPARWRPWPRPFSCWPAWACSTNGTSGSSPAGSSRCWIGSTT